MKYIKPYFELVSSDIKPMMLTLSKEDIIDMLLPLTDIGFKIGEIEDFLVDDEFYEIFGEGDEGYRGIYARNNDRNMRKNVISNTIYGAYKFKIEKEIDLIEKSTLSQHNSEEIYLYKIILDELLQISKRVHRLEWDIETSKDENARNFCVDIYIVCPHTKIDVGEKRKLLQKDYKSELNETIKSKITSMLRYIQNNTLTSLFLQKALSDFFIGSDHKKTIKDGKLYIYFGDIGKNSINTNLKKIGAIQNKYIKEIDLVSIEKFLQIYESDETDVPNEAKYVIRISFDYNIIVNDSKREIAKNFTGVQRNQ